MTIPPPTQLRTYTTLRTLHSRAEALEQLISQLQRSCLHGPAAPEVKATMTELRWQLRKFDELTGLLEATFGVTVGATTAAAPATRGKPANGRVTPDPVEAVEPAGLRGAIETFSVPDLVGMLSSLQKTGTLTLHGPSGMFVFEFEAGRVVHAVTNFRDPSMRLGAILLAQNLLTEQQLKDTLAAAQASRYLLGDVLVRTATVTAEDLRGALDEQVQRIFELAFAVRQGRFVFQEGCLSKLRQRTCLNTTQLLLEAARLGDENGDDVTAGTAGRLADRG